MSVQYISHHRPARKRAMALAARRRRIAPLIATVAAIMAAACIAPYLRPSPATFPETDLPASVIAPSLPEAVATEVSAEPAAPTAPTRRRATPANAAPDATDPGYEVLTSTELDAISQARDE